MKQRYITREQQLKLLQKTIRELKDKNDKMFNNYLNKLEAEERSLKK